MSRTFPPPGEGGHHPYPYPLAPETWNENLGPLTLYMAVGIRSGIADSRVRDWYDSTAEHGEYYGQIHTGFERFGAPRHATRGY